MASKDRMFKELTEYFSSNKKLFNCCGISEDKFYAWLKNLNCYTRLRQGYRMFFTKKDSLVEAIKLFKLIHAQHTEDTWNYLIASNSRTTAMMLYYRVRKEVQGIWKKRPIYGKGQIC